MVMRKQAVDCFRIDRHLASVIEHGMTGILYTPAADVFETQDLSLHHHRCMIFFPANWIDQFLFGGDAPIQSIMFSLH